MSHTIRTVFLLFLVNTARGDFTYGDFTYSAEYVNSVVVATITGYTGPGGNVIIPDSINGWPVKAIKAFAFEYQDTITSVSISTNVTSIGPFAFAHCSQMGDVYLSEYVTGIGPAAFADCPGMTAINVSSQNPGYSCRDGVLFDKSVMRLVEYPGGAMADYSVPDGVAAIGEAAFYYCNNLSIINFPSSLRTVGANSFFMCSSLAHLEFPAGLTNVDSWAFNSCFSLTNLTLPDSVTQLGVWLIAYSPNLTSMTIPAGVTSLAGVLRASSLEHVVIPSGVTNVSSAFIGCGYLQSVALPDSVTDVGFQAFYKCPALTNVIFGNHVTSIGQDAFSSCTALSQIVLPGSLTNLVEDTFGGCYALTNIIIPLNVSHLGYGVFYGCNHLAGVYFCGNAPTNNLGTDIFTSAMNAVVYYLPGTTGWSNTFAGRPTALWNPRAQAGGMLANCFGFTLTGTASIPIVIEATTNLNGSGWTTMRSCTLTNGAIYFSDPDTTNHPARFYRIRSP